MLAFGWHYGALAARLTVSAAIVALLVLALASWQGVRADRQADHLSARLAKLQSARAASTVAIQAAELPDVIQGLPAAPGVAQVMQTLQQAADKEGAHVMSLQADDRAPTRTALGHLDLVLSIKAPYAAILVVIQQVLDRYPGATLRQIQVARVVSSTPAVPVAVMMPMAMPGASAPQATTESEAHVTLAFWRRPLDVEAASPPAPYPQASSAASSATAASAIAAVASGAAARTAWASATSTSTSTAGATPLPPPAGASGPK
jgi:hypothetical protein